MDEKRGIGKNNDLLFKIPEDFARMKVLTTGHPIIMGRKTYESIGKVLPNRTNIIITRDSDYKVEGAIIVHSLDEAIDVAKKSQVNSHSGKRGTSKSRINLTNLQQEGSWTSQDDKNDEEIFIFGGGQVFKEALEKHLVDRLYLTIVKARLPSPGGEATGGQGDYGADTFFPDYSEFKTVLNKEERESAGYKYTFIDLEK